MTAFRPSLVLAALLVLAGAAPAQTTQPAAQPDNPPAATGAPTPLGGPAPDAVEDTPLPPAPTEYTPGAYSRDTGGIVASGGDLGVVDGPPVGTLTDANGGLGQSMWVNADRGAIEDLLGRLPLVSSDPFVRALARRVVLTVSDSPVGGAKRALATIRIERLLQGGLIDEAGTMAAALRLDNDPDFARVQAEALLYAKRDADVCGPLTATRLSAPDPFWLELRTWCFRAAGDDASADLMHAAFEVQGIKDPAFDVLADDVLNGKKTMPPAIDHPSALHIYLLRMAGLPVTNAIAAKMGTAANLLAARDPRNSAADRLSAAARISGTGALSNAELLAIINAQAIPASQLATAQATAAKMTFLPAQSLLRRAASLESRPPVKADILVSALIPNGNIDRLPQTAALQEDIATTIKPDTMTALYRFAISRALILRGKPDAAAAWYASVPDDADLHTFQVLIDLAAPTPARDAAASSAFAWFAKKAAPQQDPSASAALALGLSKVLGKTMPADAAALAGTLGANRWPGARPDPGEVRKMVSAAGQPGRKGEAILRLLAIVGANGPADLPPDVVIECVRTLQLIGLTTEARALAIEALAMTRPS
ncbi:MAG: hypothetical protein JSR60_12505 [Proteobacteria bacterium]|nr:hypothetical protein [Pseudomonadota bacterium]